MPSLAIGGMESKIVCVGVTILPIFLSIHLSVYLPISTFTSANMKYDMFLRALTVLELQALLFYGRPGLIFP